MAAHEPQPEERNAMDDLERFAGIDWGSESH